MERTGSRSAGTTPIKPAASGQHDKRTEGMVHGQKADLVGPNTKDKSKAIHIPPHESTSVTPDSAVVAGKTKKRPHDIEEEARPVPKRSRKVILHVRKQPTSREIEKEDRAEAQPSQPTAGDVRRDLEVGKHIVTGE